jgi:hypothetical protein
MKPRPFDYVRPDSTDEAVALLTEYGGEGRILAGGQSLLAMGIHERRPRPLERAKMTDDRIECVARAMCQADGNNPDEQVPSGEREIVTSGGPVQSVLREQAVIVPTWKTYERKARRFVAALDAAGEVARVVPVTA